MDAVMENILQSIELCQIVGQSSLAGQTISGYLYHVY